MRKFTLYLPIRVCSAALLRAVNSLRIIWFSAAFALYTTDLRSPGSFFQASIRNRRPDPLAERPTGYLAWFHVIGEPKGEPTLPGR
jgi:hypothetical protein